jgi:glycosyltransferase involved in cell wall biosynthesis
LVTVDGLSAGRLDIGAMNEPPTPTQLSILMPVFNERATVEAAIDDALSAELPVERRELVVVDDGSTDGTRELLESRTWPDGMKVVFHERNLGKGSAVRTALQHATSQYAAILDADLEYRAADLAEVLEPLVAGEARVVFGTRAWTSQSSFSFWYVVGNKAVTMATNVLYNCWISDVMTGHKAMETELFRSLPLREQGFAIEPEIAARVLRAGERIHEVPISYKARTREAGKKLTTLDGLRVLRTLLRCRVT